MTHKRAYRYLGCGFALFAWAKCGIYRHKSQLTWFWANVTCKNCLRHKPKE